MSTPRLITATRAGTCWTCRAPFQQGARIQWHRHGAGNRSPVWHETCATPAQYVAPTETDEQQTPPEVPQPWTREGIAQPLSPRSVPAPVQTVDEDEDEEQDADELAAQLAAALRARNKAPRIDPEQVRTIAREEAQRVSTTNEAALAGAAAATALRALQEVTAAAAAQGTRLAQVGRIPTIDPHAHTSSAAFTLVRSALERGAHVTVSGPSGSGKTYAVEQTCAQIGRPLVTVSCADGLTYGALVARTTLRATSTGTETETRYGALPLAMRAGAVLLIDEADQLQPELLAVLHSAMEPDPARRALYIPETGETIHAEQGFSVALTCNGLRDATGAYHGHRLSGAVLTRTWHAAADYMTEQEEADLLERAGAPLALAQIVAAAMKLARMEHLRGALATPPSTRTAAQIVHAMRGLAPDGKTPAPALDWSTAWQALYIGSLSSAEAQSIRPHIQNAHNAATAAAAGGAQ